MNPISYLTRAWWARLVLSCVWIVAKTLPWHRRPVLLAKAARTLARQLWRWETHTYPELAGMALRRVPPPEDDEDDDE